MKEQCYKMQNNGWQTCNHCGKRIHNDKCSTKKRRAFDCFCAIDSITETKEYLLAYGITK